MPHRGGAEPRRREVQIRELEQRFRVLGGNPSREPLVARSDVGREITALPASFFCRSTALNSPRPLSPITCEASCALTSSESGAREILSRRHALEEQLVGLEIGGFEHHPDAVGERPLDRSRNAVAASELIGTREALLKPAPRRRPSPRRPRSRRA